MSGGGLADALARRLPAGWTVVPGLVDLQVNGVAGAEVGDDPDEVAAVARALPAAGVTRFCPTVVTRSDRGYARVASSLGRVAWPADGARPLGVHLEGPFLSPARAGAHPAHRMRIPERAAVERLAALFSPRVVTLAPELPGAVEAVRLLARRGTVVSVGHTEASAEQAAAAFAAGARMLTHAFNAMAGVAAREPGPVGAALADRRVRVCLIADGVHVAAATCVALASAAGSRLVLTSDATAATGAPPGTYRLGERAIRRDAVRVVAGSRLAGGTAGLAACVATLVRMGVSRARAFAAATGAPGRLLGHAASPGDLVALDGDLVPRLTLVDGRVAFADPALPFDVPERGAAFRA
ncbi:MAG: amidohydrolase family protein [Actinomycetota bacterium]